VVILVVGGGDHDDEHAYHLSPVVAFRRGGAVICHHLVSVLEITTTRDISYDPVHPVMMMMMMMMMTMMMMIMGKNESPLSSTSLIALVLHVTCVCMPPPLSQTKWGKSFYSPICMIAQQRHP